MKSRFLVVLVLAALAGCREQAAAPAAEPAADTATTPAAAAEPVAVAKTPAFVSCAGVPGCDPLPSGLAVSIPYEVRSDRIYTHPSGADRRQVVLEFFEGDPASVLATLQQDFNAAGYENNPRATTPEGVETMVFTMPGKGSVNLWVNPAIGPKPVSDKAKGVFGIDYPAGFSRPPAQASAG